MSTNKPTMLQRCGVTRDDDTALWDDLVRQLLGPRFLSDPPDRRRQAIALAAAALRAAGQEELAVQVHHLASS
ncbi:hypothetical protein [Pseudomonas sp. 30_B]|uniref:hypothetical protein n=1 Tax=Pseudomonas sp. 30_B TaxID=2813575 RepID=UPI001A9EF20F|nr:hypothetical protein [Pseudomonas sp. 30_B]